MLSARGLGAAVVLVATVLGSSGTVAARGPTNDAFGYVLLAPGSADGSGGPVQALARVIIPAPDSPCPTLLPDGPGMSRRGPAEAPC